jgi:hypothetical protein
MTAVQESLLFFSFDYKHFPKTEKINNFPSISLRQATIQTGYVTIIIV